jgi:hypothetical protein
MRTRPLWLALAAISILAACAPAGSLPLSGDAAPARSLTAYASEDQLQQALSRWQAAARQRQAEARHPAVTGSLAMQADPAPAAPVADTAAKAEPAAESITNVQTAGVDEGGIVKRAGDHLVILRRGRLFTVRIGGDALQPAAMADAYAPGSNPQGAWYDELLVSGSTVIVIGYSYARGGTEVGLFELGRDGALAWRATYHLRSFDYYSSRNYASRLIGNTLVFYTPVLLQPWVPRPWDQMPGWRRWQDGAAPPDWQRLLPATRIYRTDDDFDPREALALHTVTRCEIGAAALRCEASAVLGPAGRVFYVSHGAVYVWTSAWRRAAQREGAPAQPLSAVFRLPLDGGAPSALKTAGVPIDQMSFLEDAGGHLNVLLRESGRGEGMWGSEATGGAMALLRVPLAAFGDGRDSAGPQHYRRVPAAQGHVVQNRFVGDWLLWGSAGGAGQKAHALRYAARDEVQTLSPGHGVERIEAMGAHAVLVGSAGADLHFSSVRLGGRHAALAGRHVQAGARQGETRSHGFFFRPTGPEEGLLGLPVLQPGRPAHGVFHGAEGAASVLFLRQRALGFAPLGELQAQPASARDDACRASCVDWYGNARPLFIGERVFALLGYEIVEGQLAAGWRGERIEERRRISFAPAGAGGGRYSPF